MAEGAFRRLAAQAGLDESGLMVDSAGTTRFHVGESPDSRAAQTARARGIDISGQRARQATAEDFRTFDYIVALDRDNHAELERISPEGCEDRLSLLMQHTPAPTPDEVPDPYYGGPEGFERCFDLIEQGAAGLLETILDRHFPDHDRSRRRQD